MADTTSGEPGRRAEARALEALQDAGVDITPLTGRSRKYIANRLRAVVASLPARDGPNRAAVRDLLALADVLERGES